MSGINEAPYVAAHDDKGHGHSHHSSKNPVSRVLDYLLPNGGMLASALTLASSTLGATTISLPVTYRQCGIVLSSFFLIICGLCTIYSVYLLAKVKQVTGLASYELLSRVLLGRVAEYITGIIMIIFCWGTAVAYIMAVGDIAKRLIPDPMQVPPAFRGDHGRQLIMSLYWLVTMLPMSLMKEINAIRYFTFIGVCAIIFFIGIIMWQAGVSGHFSDADYMSKLAYAKGDNNMVVGLSVILFAYCCQPNVYEVYTELKHPSPRRITLVSLCSMLVCTCLYLMAGFFGYVNFGEKTRGDVLKNFDPYSNYVIFASYLCFCVKLTVAYSLNIHPCRDTVLAFFKMGSYHKVADWKRLLICLILSVTALLAALFVQSLETVFGFLGGVCGSAIGFILPCLFVMYAGDWSLKTAGYTEFILVWTMLLFGIVALVFGTAGSVYSAIAP
jgi:amino acid permease